MSGRAQHEISTAAPLPIISFNSIYSIYFVCSSQQRVSQFFGQTDKYLSRFVHATMIFRTFLYLLSHLSCCFCAKCLRFLYLSTFLFCQQQTARAKKFFHQSQVPSVSCARSRLRADSCWCWKYEKYINFIYFSWPSGKYLLSRRCSNCSTLGDSTAPSSLPTSSLLMDFEQRK